MSGWRSVALLCGAVLALESAQGQTTYPIQEKLTAGDVFRLHLEMKLSGERQLRRDEDVVKEKLSATAEHVLVERVLAVDQTGQPEKAARYYEKGQVAVQLADRKFGTSLNEQRRLIVAQRHKDELICYSPSGPLTREELEVTAEHFDTLALAGLLPAQPVAVGGTWKPATSTVQALCAFDGLINQDLVGKLEAASDGQVKLTFTGSAQGIERGALIKRSITASGQYDLQAKRLVRLQWQQHDEREPGPISPGSTLETSWTIARQPLAQLPKEVSDVALVKVPDGALPPAPLLLLAHRDPQGRYQLAYARDWQIVGQTDNHLILRLLDRGDFVAQATLAWLTPAAAGKHMSVEDFQQLVDDLPGWEPEQMRDDGPVPSAKGQWIHRLSGVGDFDGLRVLQVFYLVAGPEGQQLAIHFTLRPALVEKLGSKDVDLIGGIDFTK